jgi:membrane protease YdiL (CAAX protease family)
MKQTNISPIRFFLIATFLLFWVLFLITGAAVFGGAPEIVQTVLKNVCAWSSTFVLILFFKRFYPGRRFFDFFKAQFTPVRVSDFLVPTLIQLGLAAGAISIVMAVSGESLKTVEIVPFSGLVPLLLINITSGPMGEELGWRAYALQELQKRLSPLTASLWIGLLWGLWHFPLWLVSGYTGLDLLLYSGFFLLGIISFSVFLTFFYNKSGNILVAVWIHFVFNILLQIVILDSLKVIIAVSVLYLAAAVVIVLFNREAMGSRSPAMPWA